MCDVDTRDRDPVYIFVYLYLSLYVWCLQKDHLAVTARYQGIPADLVDDDDDDEVTLITLTTLIALILLTRYNNPNNCETHIYSTNCYTKSKLEFIALITNPCDNPTPLVGSDHGLV